MNHQAANGMRLIELRANETARSFVQVRQRMDRREFGRKLAAVGGMFGLATVGCADATALEIVDAHQHLWDRQKLRLDWIAAKSPLDRNFLHAEYQAATARLNVVQAVYMEVAVDGSQHDLEATTVIDWCRTKAGVTVAGVISGRPESDDFGPYIRKYRNSPYIKGVRRLLQGADTPAGHAVQGTFIRNVQLLGELGMSFDICLPSSRLPEAIRLADACPGTTLILDHCGCPDIGSGDLRQWTRDLRDLAKRGHVACKVSGIVTACGKRGWSQEVLAPVVQTVLDAFGPDRVLFASDWPVCTLTASLREWVVCLQAIVAERSLAERKKLFAENARRIYRVPSPTIARAGGNGG